MKYAKLKKYALINNLKSRGDEPSGCSGFYMKLPHGVGVKVYTTYRTHRNYRDVIGNDEWWAASSAIYALRKLAKTKLTPKPYCVAPIKVDGGYFVGLFMEHVEGVNGQDALNGMSQKRVKSTCSKIKKAFKKLAKNGVIHPDQGSHNVVIKNNGTVKIIDFDNATILKDRTKWKTVKPYFCL